MGRRANGKFNLEPVNNKPRDFVLECKGAFQLAVIGVCPNAKTVSRVNQFGCHTNPVTMALQTSFVFLPFSENDELWPATRKPSICASVLRISSLMPSPKSS